MKPATPQRKHISLDDPDGTAYERMKERQRRIDAYPKLVAALRDLARLIHAYPRSFNAEEVNMCIYLENARVLLRELGEG